MKKNFSDYLVAFGVLLCSAILLAALTYALSGWRQKESGRMVEIDYPDITGIRVHSEVRYAGAPAGSVVAVRLLSVQERLAAPPGKKGNAVRIAVRLFEGVPPLPSDVKAALGSDTLLSEKFVALSAGNPETGRLAENAILQGSGAASLDSLLNSLESVIHHADAALANAQPLLINATATVDTLKAGFADLFPRINTVADSAQSAVATGEALLKRADKLIAENEAGVKADLDALKAALTQLQGSLKGVDRFVGSTDRQLAGRMQELGVVLQNLKVATTQMKSFTKAIGEKPSRLLFSGKPKPLPDEETILRASKPVPAGR